jgi:hypothetical protein
MLDRLLLTLAILATPAGLAGQDRSPPSALDGPTRATILFESGMVELHSDGDWGPLLGVRFGHYVDRERIVSVGLGLKAAFAGGGFGALQLGLDARLPIHPDVRPTLSGRGGLMIEPESAQFAVEAGAGVAIRVGNEQWLRLEVQVGRHGEAAGPRGFLIGLESPL